MAPRRIPTFFKILLDPSAPHLTLPPAFVRRHLTNKIPEHPILRSVNGGYSWRLKIKRTGEIYYFSDGWSNVVEDSQLGFGDFLLFWLVDQSTFKLSIFSKSGCEKDFPSKIRVEHDDDEEEEEEDEVADEEDDDDEEEEEEEEEEDEDEEDEEEDDDDDEEEEEEILDGRGRGRGGVWRRSGGDEEEEEDDDDDDDGGDIDGHDGDPFFMTVISESNKFTMRLPMEFARLAGIDAETRITIKNLDGEESQVSVESDKCTKYCKFYLSSGWSDFRRVNKLSEGDKCVFTFIRSEDKLCLARVTKKTAPPKKPASKVPAVEVSKRSRGRSPPSVEVKSAEVTKRPRGRPKRPASKIPAVEVSKRTRGPPRVEVKNKDKGVEVMKKPRGKPKKTASKVPAVEVPTRTRGRPPRVEVESKAAAGAESMKKLRGRPAKRKRGRPRRV